MPTPANISPTIVETLYSEGLLLADDARSVFRNAIDMPSPEAESGFFTLSSAGMRATTMVMHGLAWLMNRRAFLRGDMTESQLHRYGPLPSVDTVGTPDKGSALPPQAAEMADRVVRFYARLEWLDRASRRHNSAPSTPVHQLHEMLGRAVTQQ